MGKSQQSGQCRPGGPDCPTAGSKATPQSGAKQTGGPSHSKQGVQQKPQSKGMQGQSHSKAPASAPAKSSTTKPPDDPDRAWYLQNGFQVVESKSGANRMTGLQPHVKDWLVDLKQAAGNEVCA
jgi:hypothetical protein